MPFFLFFVCVFSVRTREEKGCEYRTTERNGCIVTEGCGDTRSHPKEGRNRSLSFPSRHWGGAHRHTVGRFNQVHPRGGPGENLHRASLLTKDGVASSATLVLFCTCPRTRSGFCRRLPGVMSTSRIATGCLVTIAGGCIRIAVHEGGDLLYACMLGFRLPCGDHRSYSKQNGKQREIVLH